MFFNRKTDQLDQGYQIDLVFDRSDNVMTICEIKYYKKLVDASVIADVERKISLLPKHGKKTIQRILITTEGAAKALLDRNYFDRVITLEEIFKAS